MKRAEIEKLFDGKLAEGVEVKEIIDAIMKINGDDVNLAKESAAKASNESIEEIKAQAIAEALKPYEKGGEKYFDTEAYQKVLDENKAYKEREIKQARTSAVEKLLKDGKFDTRVLSLLSKAVDDYQPKWNENNEIENAPEILKALQSNYPDFVVTETDGGFKPATPPAKGKADTEVDAFVAGFKKG